MKEHAERLLGGRAGADMSEWDLLLGGEDFSGDED